MSEPEGSTLVCYGKRVVFCTKRVELIPCYPQFVYIPYTEYVLKYSTFNTVRRFQKVSRSTIKRKCFISLVSSCCHLCNVSLAHMQSSWQTRACHHRQTFFEASHGNLFEGRPCNEGKETVQGQSVGSHRTDSLESSTHPEVLVVHRGIGQAHIGQRFSPRLSGPTLEAGVEQVGQCCLGLGGHLGGAAHPCPHWGSSNKPHLPNRDHHLSIPAQPGCHSSHQKLSPPGNEALVLFLHLKLALAETMKQMCSKKRYPHP